MLRNQHTPSIHTLPAELLRIIFTFAGELEDQRARVNRKLPPAIIISHICTLWRSIALNHGAMWSQINITHLTIPIAQLMLERSGQDALRVVRWDMEPMEPYILELVIHNIHRVEELEIHSLGRSTRRFLTNPTLSACPRLHRISVGPEVEHTEYHTVLNSRRTTEILDSKIFGGSTSHLRQLDLTGIRMPWMTLYYRNLTSIRIVGCSVGQIFPYLSPSHGADMDICDVFRECPELEILELALTKPWWNAEMEQINPQETSRSPVYLCALHTVKLDISVEYVQRILANIQANGVTTLHLNLGLLERSPDQALAPSRLLYSGSMSSFVLSTVTTLRVEANNDARSYPASIYGLTPGGTQAFRLCWIDTQLSRPRILHAIGEALWTHVDLTHLDNLEFGCNDCTSDGGNAFDYFARLSSITTLSLFGTGTSSVFPRMLEMLRSGRSGRWPNLAHLTVQTIFQNSTETGALVEWCRELRSLESIDLTSSELCAGMTEHVEQFVSSVRWLGIRAEISHLERNALELSRETEYRDPREI